MSHHVRRLPLATSFILLALTIVALPVFEFDTSYDPRAVLPAACVSTAGTLAASFAVQRSRGFLRIASGASLLLNACLFVTLMLHLHHLA